MRHRHRIFFCALGSAISMAFILFGCVSGRSHPMPLTPNRQAKLFAEARFIEDLGIGLTDEDIKDARGAPAGTTARIAFVRRPGRRAVLPLINTRINESLVLALIDSGTSHTMLDYRTALRTEVRPLADSDRTPQGDRGPGRLYAEDVLTPAGRMERFTTLVRTMSLGELRLYNIALGIINDNRGLEVVEGLDRDNVGLVLGHDFLSRFTRVTFDFPHGGVVIEAGGYYRPDLSHLLAAIQLDPSVPLPAVQAMLGDKGPFPVVLNTGGDFGLIFSGALADELDVRSLADPGKRRRKNGRIESLGEQTVNLSGFEIPNVATKIRTQSTYEEAPYAFLGNQALRDYVVTIDYSAKKMYIEAP